MFNFSPYLTINGASQHQASKDFPNAHWNQQNNGFGLDFKNNSNDGWLRDILAGQYKNSLGNNTNYAGVELGKRLIGDNTNNLSAGVLLGGVTGYAYPLVPMVMPRLSLKTGPVSTNLGWIPLIPNETPGVYTLNADFKLPFGKTSKLEALKRIANQQSDNDMQIPVNMKNKKEALRRLTNPSVDLSLKAKSAIANKRKDK